MIKALALRPTYARALAKEHKLSPPYVTRVLNRLRTLKVLVSKGELNKNIYSVNYESLLARELLRLSTLMMMKEEKVLKKLSRICPFGIYGSYSEGRQDGGSDLDLWIYDIKAKSTGVRSLLNELESSIGVRVNALYIDREKLEKLRTQDPEFYFRLRFQSLTDFLEVLGGKIR